MAKRCVYINGSAALSQLGLTATLGPNHFDTIEATALDNPEILYRPLTNDCVQADFQQLIAQLSLVIDLLIEHHSLTPEQLKKTSLFVGSSSLDISSVKATELPQDCLNPIDNIAQALVEKYQLNPLEFTFSTACTASANALIYAGQFIAQHEIDHALVIGCEFFNQLTVQGFESLELISKTSQRSLADDRDGLILGEGIGGVLLSAQATPSSHLKLLGGYSSCDTYSLTTTQEDGAHIQGVIKQSLKNANCTTDDIDLVKVHATASYANDMAEVAALHQVFNQYVPPVFALKPYIGHTLGACGVLEIALLDQLIAADFLPVPSYVLADRDRCLLTFPFPNQSFKGIKRMLINHFGFGGNNATLVLERVSVQSKEHCHA